MVEHRVDVKEELLKQSKQYKQTNKEKKITVKNRHTSTKCQSGGFKWLWLETLKDGRDVLGWRRKLRNTGKNILREKLT